MAQDTLEHKPDDELDDKLNPANRERLSNAEKDAAERTAPGSHDNLGVHPEHAEAETEALEKQFAGASAPEAEYGAAGGDDTVGKGFTDTGNNKKGFLGKLRGMKRSTRWLLIGAATGGGGIVALIILLFLLASSLKLPNLESNIFGYQFARISREYAHAGQKVTDESLSKQIARKLQNTKTGKAIVDKINNLEDKATGLKNGATGVVKNIPGVKQYLALNDKFNPSQVERNLEGQGISFGTTPKGLSTVTLTGEAASSLGYGDGVTFIAEAPEGVGRFIPGYSQYLKAQGTQKLFSQADIQGALDTAFTTAERLKSVPTFVRGVAMNNILKRIGISRIGFAVSDFKDTKTQNEQLAAADKEEHQAISPQEGVIPGEGSPVSDAANQANEEENQAITDAQADPTGNKAAALGADGTGEADVAVTTMQKALTQSMFEKTVGLIAGPVYNVAFLACVFDEGADPQSNAQIIDANNDSNERSAVVLASVADEHKYGPTDNSQVEAFDNGIAGYNAKYGGDMSGAIPLLRSSGQPYDTSGEQAAQSTAYGFQTPKTVIGGGPVWVVMDVMRPFCPVINNPGTAVAAILATLATAPTNPAEDASQGVLRTIVDRTVGRISTQISENFGKQAGLKLALKNSVTKPFKLLKVFVKNAAVVVGVESLGAIMASSHAVGVNNNGYETGSPAVNQADAGANALAQEQDRTMMFGRPLTMAEACANQTEDVQSIQTAFRSQDMYQRYFAASNYQSLVSRMSTSVYDEFSGSAIGAKPLQSLANMLSRPQSLFGRFLSLFGGKAFAAATQNCSDANAYYGNVQFGWSQDEEKLIDSDASYSPTANLAILEDNADRVRQLAQDYAYCFGYQVDPNDPDNLIPNPNATLGNLLTDDPDTPSITRDADGNVIADEGHCSPDGLSYNSTAADAKDTSPDTNHPNDLIFRWRLANRYENTQDQMSAVQNAAPSSSATPTPSSKATGTKTVSSTIASIGKAPTNKR